jgi:hypothetical protein
MNLFELILFLNGLTQDKRYEYYRNFGIHREVVKCIENCYDANNNLVNRPFENRRDKMSRVLSSDR